MSCVMRLLDVRDGFWRRGEASSVDEWDTLCARDIVLNEAYKTRIRRVSE